MLVRIAASQAAENPVLPRAPLQPCRKRSGAKGLIAPEVRFLLRGNNDTMKPQTTTRFKPNRSCAPRPSPPSLSSQPVPHAAAYDPHNALTTRQHWSAASSAQHRATLHNLSVQ